MPSPGTMTGQTKNSPESFALTAPHRFQTLQNYTPSQQDNLMVDLSAASTASQAAVSGGTHENDAQSWNCYIKYCDSIGLGGNFFLYRMPRQHRIEIMGAFAVAVHQGQFSRQGDGPLAKNTVSNTVNTVAVAFRENGWEDPHKDAERNVSRLLQRH